MAPLSSPAAPRFPRGGLQALLGLLALVALDRGLLRFFPVPEGLALTPGSRFTCATSEYRFTAAANSLGFRGPETGPHRAPVRRVLVLGDSSTFGWGVEGEEAWPAVLGRTLGRRFEVLNIGRPEAGPMDLVQMAEKAIPLLVPDLVVIAITQGDDLAQAGPRPDERGVVRRSTSGVLRAAFPGLTGWFRDRRPAAQLDETQHRELWRRIARRNRDEMTAGEGRRFAALDADVQAAFFEGRLDPRLIWRAMHVPAFYSLTVRLDSPEAARALSSLTASLITIRTLAEGQGARAIVFSVPIGVYSSRASWEGARRLGFEVSDRMLESTDPDEAIRHAATAASVASGPLNRAFSGGDGEAAFYALDGRLNRRGHESVGGRAAPFVRDALGPQP